MAAMAQPDPRGRWQRLKDRLAFPLVAFMSTETAHRWGLTPLDDERLVFCLRYVRGRLLDIGCGPNELVRRYGNGVGVDVHPSPGIDVLCDTTRLPFRDATFDTATFVASLNHIPATQRHGVLTEVHRVLRADGQALITMMGPVMGTITHRVRAGVDPDQLGRGIHHDEDLGLSDGYLRRLLAETGFAVDWRRGFVFGINKLYRAVKSR